MKKTKIYAVCALILMILGSNPVNAQCFENPPGSGNYTDPSGRPCINTILTAVPFLRITPDARSGAMGDVGLAISPDANAMHYNASKLVFAENKVGISATYTPWLRALGLQDVYLAYLGGYTQLNDQQALGVGLRFFSLGDIAFTDDQGQPIGSGKPRELEVSMAYARKLSDKLSASITGKFIYSNLAAGQNVGGVEITPGYAGAADLALTYTTPVKMNNGKKSNLTIALAATNIGSKIIYARQAEFIPSNLGIGAAWDMQLDDHNSITFAADINKLLVPTPPLDTTDAAILEWRSQSPIAGIFKSFSDAPDGFKEELRELMYSFGLEYWYDKQFAVRLGYFTESQYKGNRRYLTAGLGLKYNVFGINLSYLVPTTNQRNPLDNTLRFSLLFDFAALGAVEE